MTHGYTIDDLLAADLGPEPAEAAYRRGYCDGWTVALESLYDLLEFAAVFASFGFVTFRTMEVLP